MTTLTFIDAQATNPQQEALEVLFVYKINDSTQTQTIHVIGSDTSWGLNEPETSTYIQTLFTGTIAYIKDHGETSEALPVDKKQINSEFDFPAYQQGETAWEGYELDLAN